MEIVIELPQDMDKLCRTCMSMLAEDDKENNVFAEETELHKKLKFVLGLNISSSDGLPRAMCTDCVRRLELSYDFKQQCEDTYTNFQGFIGTSDSGFLKSSETVSEFSCTVCLEEFTSQYTLSKHEIIHFKDESLSSRFQGETEDLEAEIKRPHILLNRIDIISLIEERKGDLEIPETSATVPDEPVCEILENKDEIIEMDVTDPVTDMRVCGICSRAFDGHFQLTLHFINHALVAESNTDPEVFDQYFFCLNCGETFNLKPELEDHMQTCCNAIVEYKCLKCSEDFENEVELLKHEGKIHHDDMFLDEFLADDSQKNDYICPICAEQFTSKQELTVHSVKHVLKQVTCRICKKTFCSQVAHNNHLKSHPNYKHVCSLCGRCLGSRHALKTHIMGVHSSTSNYICNVCPKKFKTPSRLYIHKLTHKKDKKFGCEICSYKTNNVGDFKVHNRIHTCERPYKCNFVNCNKQFKTSSHLNEHIHRHLQIKKFQCTECNMVFGHNHTLKMHLMTHTGEKPFDCTECSAKFRRKHHLKNHMRQHELCNMQNTADYIIPDKVYT